MMDDGLLEEFVCEASELLDEAEDALLRIEKSEDLEENFNSVFRVFHSLKGSAGMIGFEAVQKHMHLIEDRFEFYKQKLDELPNTAGFFLDAVDHGRLLLEGTQAEFDYALQKEALEDKGGTIESKDGETTVDDVFNVDLLGAELKNIPAVKSLEGQIQFNVIEDVETYIKRRQYFHANAVVVEATDYNNIKPKIKDDIPVLVHGCMANMNDNTVLMDQVEELSPQHFICSVSHSKVIMKILLLLDKSIKFNFYQYTDLEKYLLEDKREAVRTAIQEEIQNIIKLKGDLFK